MLAECSDLTLTLAGPEVLLQLDLNLDQPRQKAEYQSVQAIQVTKDD